jgi:hypothetical protein
MKTATVEHGMQWVSGPVNSEWTVRVSLRPGVW